MYSWQGMQKRLTTKILFLVDNHNFTEYKGNRIWHWTTALQNKISWPNSVIYLAILARSRAILPFVSAMLPLMNALGDCDCVSCSVTDIMSSHILRNVWWQHLRSGLNSDASKFCL